MQDGSRKMARIISTIVLIFCMSMTVFVGLHTTQAQEATISRYTAETWLFMKLYPTLPRPGA